jgi:hypothetical protein
MKKLFLLVLCCFWVAGSAQAGAGGNSAKQDEQLRQAGKSSIYFYDVQATDSHGTGKLVIDADKQTFVIIGHDFPPDQLINLHIQGDSNHVFATGKTTPSGNLHITGAWEPDHQLGVVSAVVSSSSNIKIYGFRLHNEGWFITKLAAYYSTDGGATWTESGHTDDMIQGDYKQVSLHDLGVPDRALVKIHVIVVAGKDRTGSEVYQGYFDSRDYVTGYFCFARYDIKGTTWNPDLEYEGGVCEAEYF